MSATVRPEIFASALSAQCAIVAFNVSMCSARSCFHRCYPKGGRGSTTPALAERFTTTPTPASRRGSILRCRPGGRRSPTPPPAGIDLLWHPFSRVASIYGRAYYTNIATGASQWEPPPVPHPGNPNHLYEPRARPHTQRAENIHEYVHVRTHGHCVFYAERDQPACRCHM